MLPTLGPLILNLRPNLWDTIVWTIILPEPISKLTLLSSDVTLAPEESRLLHWLHLSMSLLDWLLVIQVTLVHFGKLYYEAVHRKILTLVQELLTMFNSIGFFVGQLSGHTRKEKD